jgi:hypothetical protein
VVRHHVDAEGLGLRLALDVDDLVDGRERDLGAAEARRHRHPHRFLVGAVVAERDGLVVDVGDVVAGGGRAPRDVAVEAEHDAGQTRERDALGVEVALAALVRGVEVHVPPHRRRDEREVWIVREDGVAAGGDVARDDPAVGADVWIAAQQQAVVESVEEGLRAGERARIGQVHGGRRQRGAHHAGAAAGVAAHVGEPAGVGGERRARRLAGEEVGVDAGARGEARAGRAARERAHHAGELGAARDVGAGVVGEVPRLEARQREDVRGLPVTEVAAARDERQRLVAARGDEVVLLDHAIDVLVDALDERLRHEARRRVGGERLVDGAAGAAEAEEPVLAVVVDEAGRERACDLREPAGHAAADELHLREAILRHEVALDEEHVVDRGAVDVRHAALVDEHLDRPVEAGHGDVDGGR